MIDPVHLSLNQTRKKYYCRLCVSLALKDGEYSDTLFCIAENIAGGKTLKTCALRPAGIYGEGELRHLPRIVVSESQMAYKLTDSVYSEE